MNLLCRLCLGQSAMTKNVFCTKLSRCSETLVDVLFWMFAIEVSVTDPYPKEVCYECLLLIEYVLEIKNTFRRNEALLKEKFKNNISFSEVQPPPLPVTPTVQTPAVETFYVSDDDYHNNPAKELHKSIVVENPSNEQNKNELSHSPPGVWVTLSTLEELCPTVSLERFEESYDYSKFKHLGNGRFKKTKKKKYRQFAFDNKLMDDICGMLSDSNDIFSHIPNDQHTPSFPVVKNKVCKKKTGLLNHPITVKQTPKSHSVSKCFTRNYVRRKASEIQRVRVWLEPVEYLIQREHYKKVDEFVYVKDPSTTCEQSDKQFFKQQSDTNFPSFLNVSKAEELYVCTFCSKSFLYQRTLKLHQQHWHQINCDIKVKHHYVRKQISNFTKQRKFCKTKKSEIKNKQLLNNYKLRNNPRKVMKQAHSGRESSDSSEESSAASYIWEKKSLGTYSAIKFCKDVKPLSSNSVYKPVAVMSATSRACKQEVNYKNDDNGINKGQHLDDVIKKLGIRLDKKTDLGV